MPSDHPAPLARLAGLLAQAGDGVRPTPRELAELLWLAGRMSREEGEPARPPDEAPVPAEPPSAGPAADPPPAPRPDPAGPPVPGTPEDPVRIPLRLPSPTPASGPYAALLAPAPSMLRHPLALQRSLRPLKRRTDAPSGHRLDEPATADRIARLGAAPEWWLPVLRPARERWLRLNLVYDDGPTMPVWHPLLRELHTALAQSGVFRTVARYRAGADGTVRGAAPPAEGRTVTLLISDCMGPQWRPGAAGARWYATLRRWARQMPLAVLQPLPEHLWRDTALPASPGLLSAPSPAAPTAALTFTPYEGELPEGPVLPVLEAGPRWLANWAGLVASAGGVRFPGAAAPLAVGVRGDSRTDVSRLSAEDLVLRFRATASPEAFRLAGHLALGRPDLPVMRLVQRAVEPDPRPQHLAEVILSGVLTAVPGPPGSYAFRPGARELLLRSLPRAARGGTSELLARVGGLIEERAGTAAGEFRAVAATTAGTSAAGEGEAFATVRAESVRRLAGGGAGAVPVARGPGARYRLVRQLAPGGSTWLAEDVETDRTVTVRLHEPFRERGRRERFLGDAGRLRSLTHPNVVAVLDFGLDLGLGDGAPYVVTEWLDGIALSRLAPTDGESLSAPLITSIGAQLADAVTALHAAGLAHGSIGLPGVMLLPDGTVRLTRFEPGRASGSAGQGQDLRALRTLLLRLTAPGRRAPAPAPALAPSELEHLPRSVQGVYANALNMLASKSLRVQRQGLALLTEPHLRHAAGDLHRTRFYHLLSQPLLGLPHDRREVDPLAGAVLAMLLLKHGRVVSRDELGRGLWSAGEEPRDVTAELALIVSRLRGLLGPGVLARHPDGCALHVGDDYVDLLECEGLERRATQLAAEGRLTDARGMIDQALQLWQGREALPGIPGPAARTARTRLLRLRLALHRKRAELDLDLGDYERAAVQLADLLRAHPSQEDLLRLLLIALNRLGRTDEALEVYEEYELAGGTDPELRAIGHELRAEFEQPGDGGEYEPPAPEIRAPDEPEEGSFPTEESLPSIFAIEEEASARRESPLPQNVVPESLFAVEDPPGAEEPPEETGHGPADADSSVGKEPSSDTDTDTDTDTEGHAGWPPPPTYRTLVTYEFADGPRHPDDVAALGRAVTRLVADGGPAPGEYVLAARGNGFSVLTEPDVSGLPLVLATMRRFEDEVRRLGGPRCLVVFSCVHQDGRTEAPALSTVRRTLDAADDRRGIIAVPQLLRDELEDDTDAGRSLLPLRSGTAEGWFLLCPAARPPYDGSPGVPPVHGPYRLPDGDLWPEPAGETRTVVYEVGGDGRFSFTRIPEATGYYEVALTEHRLELDVSQGPFRAVGEARWRITDLLQVAALGVLTTSSDVVVNCLRGRLRYLSDHYPRTYVGQAQAELGTGPGRSAPRGLSIHWDLTLTATHVPYPVPPVRPERVDLNARLRRADAVMFGFDGTLVRLHPDDVNRQIPLLARLLGPDPLGRPSMLDPQHVSPELRARLTAMEAQVAERSVPLADADLAVRTLADMGLQLAVVTGGDPYTATAYLRRRGLLDCLHGGVHGREGVYAPLTTDPHVVSQALHHLGVRPSKCLMVGATEAERTAARQADIPFFHVGGEPGLRPLLEAARAL
ncbi:SAV_2336 N-terminal domain-related protein [Streptomyces sp. NPDC086777]|uniref:SAV_2336 N-terminal domain-related protein n=1 Tax=Streptomyces sp. NPDC086777 TaxID=3154866 RepID=UPI00344D553D